MLDKALRRSDAEVVFTAANIEEDSKSAASQVNQDRALCRFELMETLIRLAQIKFLKTSAAASISEAVRMLMEHHVKPVLEPLEQWLDSNVFRKEQLYR